MGTFLMLRHAQSTWNAEGRWQGQADPPLSAAGEEQAHRGAAVLAGEDPYDLVVSSDLRRARQTAEILAADLGFPGEVLSLASLREYDVGEWSGLTRHEIEGRWPGLLVQFTHRELPGAPGGERRLDFDHRVAGAAREVAHIGAGRGARRILVVAHGGVVRSLARMAGLPEDSATHLAGYGGTVADGTLEPDRAVDLLATPEVESADQIVL